MRLSSMADYAVVTMVAAARRCARGGDAPVNAGVLAEDARLPLPTVQKLVSRLVAAGLLTSQCGAGGGLALVRPAAEISLAQIVEAVEGPIALTACVEQGRHDCAMEEACAVRPHWADINATFRDTLAGVPLSRLVAQAAMEIAEVRAGL